MSGSPFFPPSSPPRPPWPATQTAAEASLPSQDESSVSSPPGSVSQHTPSPPASLSDVAISSDEEELPSQDAGSPASATESSSEAAETTSPPTSSKPEEITVDVDQLIASGFEVSIVFMSGSYDDEEAFVQDHEYSIIKTLSPENKPKWGAQIVSLDDSSCHCGWVRQMYNKEILEELNAGKKIRCHVTWRGTSWNWLGRTGHYWGKAVWWITEDEEAELEETEGQD